MFNLQLTKMHSLTLPAHLRLPQIQEAQRKTCGQLGLLLQQPRHAGPDLPVPRAWVSLLHLLACLHLRRV